jgi:predicted glycosyltransferase
MVDFEAEYGLDGTLAGRLQYCGYLGRGSQRPADVPYYERPFVLASGGGGVDGAGMFETFARAASRLRAEIGGTWLMVTGPLMPPAEHERLASISEPVGVDVRRVVPELRAHCALADCIVSMAGYNTVCDVLSYRRPAVLIPRREPSHEQRIRAQRLREWGVAEVLAPAEADPDRLAEAMDAVLGTTPPPSPVPLDGLERAVGVFDTAIERTTTSV